jgi:hypothetical protein
MFMRRLTAAAYVAIVIICAVVLATSRHNESVERAQIASMAVVPVSTLSPFQKAVVDDLNRQVAAHIVYQDGYFTGGDPPPGIGVCTDVVVRSYRAAGIDIRKLVQADIRANPSGYDIRRPDPNIDHRRCRNLAVFFKHSAKQLPTEGPKADWQPGDIVIWDVGGNGVPNHIGIIGEHVDVDGNPTVVHHWPGQFVMEQDWLYRLPVLYHFRWKE